MARPAWLFTKEIVAKSVMLMVHSAKMLWIAVADVRTENLSHKMQEIATETAHLGGIERAKINAVFVLEGGQEGH